MKHILTFFAAAAAALLLAACATEPEAVSTLNTPVPGAEQDFGYQRVTTPELSRNYVQRIQEKTAQAEKEGKDIKFVMVGDSITHFWEQAGKEVMDANFAKYHPLDLGFAGDRTQNCLYVIEKTDIFSKIDPQLVMLLIGVNNFGWRQADVKATAEGIRLCVLALKEKAPNARILLLGIFPTGNTPDDQNRPKIAATNEIIKGFADNKTVFYEDLGPKFLTPTGVLERDIMGDFLHPTAKGYQIWADAIRPYVEKYCKSSRPTCGASLRGIQPRTVHPCHIGCAVLFCPCRNTFSHGRT